MPRIKRWFHVSHDINSDPEVIELTDKFGLMGLKVWLELLSIGDRNEGRLPELSHSTHRSLSIKCNSTVTRVSLVCDWCVTRSWIICDPLPRIRNWLIYNPSRDAKKSELVSPPNLPILTSLPKEKTYVDATASTPPSQLEILTPESDEEAGKLTVKDLVDSWNESFGDLLPRVVLPLSGSRQRKALLRVKEHQSLDYWQRVFTNIAGSDFLTGKSNGSWRCTFDFLINNDTNAIKIYEGAYQNGNKDQTKRNQWQGRR